MTTHPVLSDRWIAEARRIKADHIGDATDQPGRTVTPRSLAHGDIDIDGDFDEFRDWWHSRVGDDATHLLEDDVRAITG